MTSYSGNKYPFNDVFRQDNECFHARDSTKSTFNVGIDLLDWLFISYDVHLIENLWDALFRDIYDG